MNQLPPNPDFSLTPQEEQKIIEHLCDLDIAIGSITRSTRDWKHSFLVKPSRGTHALYPHFKHILALYASDPKRYADPDGGNQFEDVLKYRLMEDLYKEGLYDPSPGSYRLHGLIDILYFPDHVRALCNEADAAAGRPSGTNFDDVVNAWQLMALGVDDTLYRHSSTAYSMYAPYWDVQVRFKIGIKLIKLAIFNGDYELAKSIVDFLRKQFAWLGSDFEVKYYTDLLLLLELNSQVHLHETDAYPADIREYRDLYRTACSRNNDVASLSALEQKRHVKLLRAICVGGCRHSVRHVMRVLSSSDATMLPQTLKTGEYLAKQIDKPDLNSTLIDHSKRRKTSHDWDTLARASAVVVCEFARVNRQEQKTQEYIDYARWCHEQSVLARGEWRRKDEAFFANIRQRSELAKWLENVDPKRINLGTLFVFWSEVTDALINLQCARYPSVEGDRSQYFENVFQKLQDINELKHAAKLKHSRHMLPSIQAVAVAERSRFGLGR